MTKPNIENLRALSDDIELNPYQLKLASNEMAFLIKYIDHLESQLPQPLESGEKECEYDQFGIKKTCENEEIPCDLCIYGGSGDTAPCLQCKDDIYYTK